MDPQLVWIVFVGGSQVIDAVHWTNFNTLYVLAIDAESGNNPRHQEILLSEG